MNTFLYVAHLLWVLLPLSVLFASGLRAEAAEEGLDPDRVQAVAAMLPEQPTGLGRPLADRAAWERLAAEEAYQPVLPRAEKLLTQPLPEQPDDLYLEFSRTGNRTHWQNVASERRGRLTWLVLAECLEDQGRFRPAIEELIAALCAERTWVMPAHDGNLANFNGTSIDIDLASSALAWNLATADYLLGDRLSDTARQLLRENVRRRVLDPYRAMFTGERNPNRWMLTTNNWNAVCLAGVTGAGLALLETRAERAQFVAAAEKYSRNFLAGFTPDGYCSEGLGYWNYGFGHYVLLAETVRQATDGGVDLLARPEVRMPATFGARIQIIGGVSPAFADCSVNARPDAATMYLVNRRFGLGLHEYEELNLGATLGSLFEAMLYAFLPPSPGLPGERPEVRPGRRTWFEHAGILIGRPGPDSSCRLGVALKGGHNAEHHNHNDVGSYVVVVGERPVLLDPGAETYTARTFSSRRYESKLLNSFGHPVPIVAGQLQRTGREAQGQVLRTEFTDPADTLELDLTSAYAVPELKTLQRTFVYSREGAGSLTVTDHVEFNSPQTFGTALITKGGWQRLEDGGLLVYDVEEAVRVDIDAGNHSFALEAEEIQEDAPVIPTRLGINLTQPVTTATITVKITPLAPSGDETAGALLRNGGFEVRAWGWEVPKNGLGSISTEQAASGRFSLKITDHDGQQGSNVSSARIPVEGAGTFLLRGQVFHVAGEGIGLYVKFFNAQGEMLNAVNDRGYFDPVGSLTGKVEQWESFAFPFQTPPETATMQLWIHSYSTAEVEAYLDNLEIVKEGP